MRGTTTTPDGNTIYIGLDQCRQMTNKEAAILEIQQQPYFVCTYKQKQERILEINRKLKRLDK